MSANNSAAPINCQDALAAITFFIDHGNVLNNPASLNSSDIATEISFEFSEMAPSLFIHFQECSPCEAEKVHEERVVRALKSALASECCEQAPEDLQQRLIAQTELLAAQMAAAAGFAGMGFGGVPGVSTQVTTTYSRTEITIDGETHVEIETSHEIRHDF